MDILKVFYVLYLCIIGDLYAKSLVSGTSGELREWSSRFSGEVSYERFERLNDPKRKISLNDWLELSLKLGQGTDQGAGKEADKSTDKSDGHHLEFDFFGESVTRVYFNDKYEFNYSIPEIYISFKDRKNEFYLGRKIIDWNPNDKFWLLGHVNGLQGFSLLDDKQEGLLGLHFYHQAGDIGFKFFISYITIPTMNPSIEIKNGRVSSTSEWRKLPPTKTIYANQPIDIYYNLNDPKISDLIFKKSIGLDLSYKWRTGAIHAFAIYKPENTIRANAQASVVNVGGDYIVEVMAEPIINSHSVYGMGVHQWIGPMKLSVGADFIDPYARLGRDFKIFNSNQTARTFHSEFFKIEPRYDREAYAHAGFSYFSDTSGPEIQGTVFSLNMIHLLSSNIRNGDDFFSDTVKWKTALGMQLKYAITERLRSLVDFRYDFERRDNILKLEGRYRFTNFLAKNVLTLAVGVELLKAPDGDSYWAPYRANDTIYSNISYHF